MVTQHREKHPTPACTWQALSPMPSPSSSPVPFSIAFPFHPSPSGTSLHPLPQLQSQPSPEVPHLKLVQRKPGKMGAAAPTGIEQQAYSSGTGSSGSHWSPHGALPVGGRMEELVELGKGTLVKNSHPRDQQTPSPNSHTHSLCHSICPSSHLHTQS